jgi:tetraprenyl-beta-curcumene synthase
VQVLRVLSFLASAGTFVCVAARYWLVVFPCAARELRRWRRRARTIPDPALRELALASLRVKRGNVEGAAAFAILAPRSQRARVVRMLVAWQAAYDYADTLAELPCANPTANGRELHHALLTALSPEAPLRDYYRHSSLSDDGGYLAEMVDTTRDVFAQLPSRRTVEHEALGAAQRIVDYQALNYGTHTALANWAVDVAPAGADLHWWEVAAAGASSLAVLALLTSASEPALAPRAVRLIERAYFPWIGCLHTLLDSLVDVQEDAESGQPSLLAQYRRDGEMVSRMRLLADMSRQSVVGLPQARAHALLLAGMAALYLSAPEAERSDVRCAARAVAGAFGPIGLASMHVHRARRVAGALVGVLSRL